MEDLPDHAARVMGAVSESLNRDKVVLVCVPDCAMAEIAFTTMAERYGQPLMVLVDHDVPIGPGPLLVARLRQVHTYLGPIIAISGIPQNNDNLMVAGATSAIHKDNTEAIKSVCRMEAAKRGLG